MIDIGKKVIYGIHGVCSVTGMEQQKVGDKRLNYLILEPLNQPGSRFMVPAHNETAMSKVRELYTPEELDRLLNSKEAHAYCWIEDEGKRKQTYRELINSGNRLQLMAMIHTLYCHKSQQDKAGRKVHLCDENFLRDAEKLLIGELSFVMNMDQNRAKQYLTSCLQK